MDQNELRFGVRSNVLGIGVNHPNPAQSAKIFWHTPANFKTYDIPGNSLNLALHKQQAKKKRGF